MAYDGCLDEAGSNTHVRSSMIELVNLSRTFPRRSGGRHRVVRALDGVNLTLPAGQVSAVVGPNAAGKTTLFGLVLGFLKPSGGEVRIEGRPPRSYVRESGVGYVPDRFALADGWRVRSGLMALARLEGLSRREADRRVAGALDRFGLGAHASRSAGELSPGLLQRVGLAQAAVAGRDLVVLDEPARGLDPLWRVRLRDWVHELRSEGRTVLLASHDLAEVERLAEDVVLLDDGRVKEVLRRGHEEAAEERYRISLTEPVEGLGALFPGASSTDEGRVWTLTVADAGELSDRLSAALSLGARVRRVEPVREGLEDRVRRALGGEGREGPAGRASPREHEPGEPG